MWYSPFVFKSRYRINKLKYHPRYSCSTQTTQILDIWVNFFTHFKWIFLFQNHPPFLNINLDSAPISCISKYFWNISTSSYRHPLSPPNVYPQIWGTIQRYAIKMPCNCFSGSDVEMLFSCFGIHPTTSIMESIQTPPIRVFCFSFQSTQSYYEDLSRKQKFKNFSVSLARWHQKMECCNLINNQLTPDSHLLFATENGWVS